MISYKHHGLQPFRIEVRRDRKRVGNIMRAPYNPEQRDAPRYFYRTTGGHEGARFETIEQVKASIEGRDEQPEDALYEAAHEQALPAMAAKAWARHPNNPINMDEAVMSAELDRLEKTPSVPGSEADRKRSARISLLRDEFASRAVAEGRS